MNQLQDAGVISDNCVTFADVAEPDRSRALDWIEAHTTKVQDDLF